MFSSLSCINGGSSLVGSKDVDKAAIFNAEGTSVWAASPNFKVCQHPFPAKPLATAQMFRERRSTKA